MADAADLDNLSARVGNLRVDGVKVGETFLNRKFKWQRRAKASFIMQSPTRNGVKIKPRKYTEVQLVTAVQESFSIRQVLTKLGLVEAGGNYASVKRFIQQLNLDVSHFDGQAWRKGIRIPVVAAKDISELLRKGSQCQSHKLKTKILALGLKPYQCEKCRLSLWLENAIPLELHHQNGDVTDNRLENLQLLCPNCHALTENYRGRKLAKCRDETAPA